MLRLHNSFLCLLTLWLLSGCTPAPTLELPSPTAGIVASATSLPTATPLPPTPMPLPSPTPTATSTLHVTPLPAAQEITFVFVSETIPDGTNFQPGQTFHKTWTIKNASTHTWDKDFTLTKTSSTPEGEALSSPDQIPLSKEVKPGETLQIGVDLVAPKQNGRYTVFYRLQDAAGAPLPNSQVWVTIAVGNTTVSGPRGIITQLKNGAMQNGEFAVDFCMQLPDGRAWYPWEVTLLANSRTYSPSGSRIDPTGATTANKCFSFSFPASISGGKAYRLSIGKVELPPEVHQAENCAYAQKTLRVAYPGLDFKCAGPGAWYTNLVLPSGMTKEQADRLILDAMSSSIYGPWVLNGNAP